MPSEGSLFDVRRSSTSTVQPRTSPARTGFLTRYERPGEANDSDPSRIVFTAEAHRDAAGLPSARDQSRHSRPLAARIAIGRGTAWGS